MADKSVQVSLTTAYQRIETIIATKLASSNLPPLLRKHFRVIKIQVDPSATGPVTFQRGTSVGTNPFLILENGNSENSNSGTRLNNESIEGLWVKGTSNGDLLNILLQE